MDTKQVKNVKISVVHHNRLKKYCDKNGFKLYKVLEKWIDQNCSERTNSLYDE